MHGDIFQQVKRNISASEIQPEVSSLSILEIWLLMFMVMIVKKMCAVWVVMVKFQYVVTVVIVVAVNQVVIILFKNILAGVWW